MKNLRDQTLSNFKVFEIKDRLKFVAYTIYKFELENKIDLENHK